MSSNILFLLTVSSVSVSHGLKIQMHRNAASDCTAWNFENNKACSSMTNYNVGDWHICTHDDADDTTGTCYFEDNVLRWEHYDVAFTSSMTQSTCESACRSFCEARWQALIDGEGFSGAQPATHTSTYDYETVVSGVTWSRGCCTTQRYFDQNDLSDDEHGCTSMFVKNRDTAITATTGLTTETKSAGDTYSTMGTTMEFAWSKAEQLHHACATEDMGGDPHVTNLNGESFDILQEGKFTALSIIEQKDSVYEQQLLEINIEIARVAQECSEAYIHNMTLTGPWISEMGYTHLHLRARPTHIEVAINGTNKWISPRKLKGFHLQKEQYLTLRVNQVAINVDIMNFHKNTKYDYQAKVRELGWSFLNLQFFGVKALAGREHTHVGGLIGYDDYRSATILPENCKGFSRTEGVNPFLSSVRIH